jgi:hypothetical protein
VVCVQLLGTDNHARAVDSSFTKHDQPVAFYEASTSSESHEASTSSGLSLTKHHQNVQQGERVLPARQAHEHTVAVLDHTKV